MPDTPLADRDGGPYDPPLERRVLRLEEDGRQVIAAISTLEIKVDRLETKFDRLEGKVDRLEGKVDRLELGFVRLEAMLAATLPHLATKAEVAELKADLTAALSDKPSKTYMWGILAVLLAAYACGLAGLAVLK